VALANLSICLSVGFAVPCSQAASFEETVRKRIGIIARALASPA
jgi:hypothetical protein